MLIDGIKAQIGASMKASDSIRVGALKAILTVLETEQKSGRPYSQEIEDKALVGIVRQYKKSIEEISKSSSDKARELIEQYTKELNIIQEYAPKEITTDELEKYIHTIIDGMDKPIQMKDVMGAVKRQYPTSDGKIVAQIVKSLI